MNESLGTLQNDPSIYPSHSIVPEPPKRGGGLGPGGWQQKITREMLQSFAAVNELWKFALGRGWVIPDDRVGFTALAAHIGKTVKDADNPGGKFTNRVKLRDWDAAPLAAWHAARNLIEKLEATT
jgi:hypothetical protein